MRTVSNFFLAAALAAVLAAGGCGGGSDGQVAGIGGTGKIASGTITGFGSIFVNGGEYEIAGADCNVDDEDRSFDCQNALRIGMVVTVTSDSFVGTSGTATGVLFDDDVEGPVANLIDDGSSKRFTVLGTTVIADAATTRFENFTYDTISVSDVVEVSGYFDAGGVLHATYIERRGVFVAGSTVVEIKGSVSSASAASFTVNGVTVNLSAGTDLSDVPGGVVTVGMFVEAKGVLDAAGEISASRVEQEDDAIGDNAGRVSLEGLITDFVDNSNFRVAGQAVDASSATLEPASLVLANGLRVEIEGSVSGGVLVASEVEAEGGEIEINATVSGNPSGSSFVLTLGSGPGTLIVSSDARTEYEDETGGTLNAVSDLSDGDFVEVRAFDDGAGSIVAGKIRRDFEDHVILQGPVDSYIRNLSITVLGITFQVQGSTSYEDTSDASISATAFFDALDSDPNRVVKIRDNRAGTGGNPVGVADEVDLED